MAESWFRNKPRSNSIMSMLGVPQPGQMGSPPSWGNSNYPPISSPFPYSPRPLPQWPQQPQPQPRSLAPSILPSLGLPPPNYKGVGDDNYDEPGSQTPADASVPGDYESVTRGGLARGALGLSSLAFGGIPSLAVMANKAFGDPLGRAIDIPSYLDMAKALDHDMNDLGAVSTGFGPQSDPTALGGWGISSMNLDSVGGQNYDFSEYGYGLQGIKNALNGVTAAEAAEAEAGFGDAGFGAPGGFGDFGDDLGENVGEGDGGGSDDGGTGGADGNDDEGNDGGGDGGDSYAKGGLVKRLKGKNPPGPDDGKANLDIGEYVIRADAVEHYGADFFERLNSRKILKKSARGLLGVK